MFTGGIHLQGKILELIRSRLIWIIEAIKSEIYKLKSDKRHIIEVRKDESEKDEAIASEKVKKIKKIIGF